MKKLQRPYLIKLTGQLRYMLARVVNIMNNDFRCVRKKLPPEAFAYAEGPDLPPQDLIEEDIWNSIISLPDDVSLRTSDDHGTELKFMHGLWSSIIESVGDTEDIMWHSLLDVADARMGIAK